MTNPNFSAKLDAPDLVVMGMSGSMDAVAMEVALEMLVPVMEEMVHGGALIRASNVEWPTLGAIGVELRHWGQMMAFIRKIDRVAILSDQAWLKHAAAVESALIPNLVIHSFALDEEETARRWLATGKV